MGMGFAPIWFRQVSPPASQNHFNHCSFPLHLLSHSLPLDWYNFRNGGTHCDWPELNPNPNPMPNPNPTLNLTLKISVIYAVQLPNVFRKLIATIRRVPWIILF